MIMGYRLVQAVLVVTVGRLGQRRFTTAWWWCSP
jgi:hypothetical protein